MTIYRLANYGTGAQNPMYIHGLSIEVHNIGQRNFDVLVEAYQNQVKIAEVLNQVRGVNDPQGNQTSLPMITTGGLPFELRIITNRNTLATAIFHIYAWENGQNVGTFTNEHLSVDGEEGG